MNNIKYVNRTNTKHNMCGLFHVTAKINALFYIFKYERYLNKPTNEIFWSKFLLENNTIRMYMYILLST